MDGPTGSTIAALCYARDPEIDFHDLVTELSRVMLESGHGVRLDIPCPGLALCDTTGMRLGLSRTDMTRTFPGSRTAAHYPWCILLSAGPGPGACGADVLQPASFDAAGRDLTARIQDLAAADRVLIFERPGAFDAEVNDALLDDIRAHLDRALKRERTACRQPVSDEIRGSATAVPPQAAGRSPTPAGAGPRAAHPAARTLPAPPAPTPSEPAQLAPDAPEDIVLRLASRVDAEIARLERARRAFETAEAGADHRAQQTHGLRVIVPRLFPGRPPSTLGLLRMPGAARRDRACPDYDQMPANVDERPLLHRVAVNALNVAVMTIALPVGAALLTMSVLGREDMLFSSRVTAVTGVGVGLYNTGVVQSVLSLFS